MLALLRAGADARVPSGQGQTAAALYANRALAGVLRGTVGATDAPPPPPPPPFARYLESEVRAWGWGWWRRRRGGGGGGGHARLAGAVGRDARRGRRAAARARGGARVPVAAVPRDARGPLAGGGVARGGTARRRRPRAARHAAVLLHWRARTAARRRDAGAGGTRGLRVGGGASAGVVCVCVRGWRRWLRRRLLTPRACGAAVEALDPVPC